MHQTKCLLARSKLGPIPESPNWCPGQRQAMIPEGSKFQKGSKCPNKLHSGLPYMELPPTPRTSAIWSPKTYKTSQALERLPSQRPWQSPVPDARPADMGKTSGAWLLEGCHHELGLLCILRISWHPDVLNAYVPISRFVIARIDVPRCMCVWLRIFISYRQGFATFYTVLESYPKAPCNYVVYTWSLKGLPYHYLRTCGYTIKLHGAFGLAGERRLRASRPASQMAWTRCPELASPLFEGRLQ